MSTYVASGLYAWTLTYADGSTRTVLGSSLDSVISESSPVVAAQRKAAYPGTAPDPTVTGLSPATAALAAAPFTLTVQGTNFYDGCVILRDGVPVPTTYVSATALTTPVTMAGAVVGAVPVAVRPLAGLDTSSVPFTVTAT